MQEARAEAGGGGGQRGSWPWRIKQTDRDEMSHRPTLTQRIDTFDPPGAPRRRRRRDRTSAFWAGVTRQQTTALHRMLALRNLNLTSSCATKDAISIAIYLS